MDCANCKHGQKFRDGVYRREDGSSTVVYSGGNNIVCTKESVSSITMVDGDIRCADFDAREAVTSNTVKPRKMNKTIHLSSYEDIHELSEMVLTYRLMLGLTQTRAAEQIGIDNSTLSRIESGNVKDLPLSSMLKLSSWLRITITIGGYNE